MDALTLRWSADGSELPLGMGVHGLAPGLDGVGLHADLTTASVRIAVDGKGIWLLVAKDSNDVHVNGRPVRRVALLRPGDRLHLDGVELQLRRAVQSTRQRAEVDADSGDPRVVLRGVGGPCHGQAIGLSKPLWLGEGPQAALSLVPAGREVRVALVDGRVLLHDRSGQTQVNGHLVQQAELADGDQLVFDGAHRFVLELPVPRDDLHMPTAAIAATAASSNDPPRARAARRVPWVLLAAILIAAVLSGLLWLGS